METVLGAFIKFMYESMHLSTLAKLATLLLTEL